MVNSDTTITKGVPARFDPKAVAIITEIRKMNGSTYSIPQLAEKSGCPTSEVSRYIKEEIYEPRTYDWLLKIKQYNPPAYRHYLENHYLRKNPHTGETELMVNFSKFNILKMVARLMGFSIVKGKNERGTDIVYVIDYEEGYETMNDLLEFTIDQ